MDQQTANFIASHKDDDIHQLALQYGKFPTLDMAFILRQINGLQKIKHKVPLFYNNPEILFPVQLSLEQSSSESTAKYKSTLCEGELLIDLTGGFGIDCCFMSTKFEHAIYVERNSELCDIARHNFQRLEKQFVQIVNDQSENFLSNYSGQADWIFIDPARRSDSGKKVALLDDCEPNVRLLAPALLSKAENVMIKLSPMIDISNAVQSLINVAEIHVVSVDNECKEVLMILNRKESATIKVTTINLTKTNENEQFEFILQNENKAHASIADKIDTYLYEPNSAILKAGAFKLLSEKLEINKLHKNSHLYTSDNYISNFPGRKFSIIKVWESGKNELKALSALHPKANIAVRNYPLSVDEIRKKLKIKDGGYIYLFATTLSNEHKVIIECEKAID